MNHNKLLSFILYNSNNPIIKKIIYALKPFVKQVYIIGRQHELKHNIDKVYNFKVNLKEADTLNI